MNPQILWILCPLIFLAGLVDSIAGGGGLISLAAYSFYLPPVMALGNNKFSSTCGTFVATIRYFRNGAVDMRVAPLAVIGAIIGSQIGSHLALYLNGVYLQYLLLVLVPVLGVLTFKKTDFGSARTCAHLYLVSFATGLVIGTYDGFFGPGTGMFLTWLFSAIVGLELIKAVGTTKIVNLSSNIAAIVTFIMAGDVDYRIGIPCALCSILGGYVGSGLALHKGSRIIKPMLAVVLVLLFINIVRNLFF